MSIQGGEDCKDDSVGKICMKENGLDVEGMMGDEEESQLDQVSSLAAGKVMGCIRRSENLYFREYSDGGRRHLVLSCHCLKRDS